MANYRQQWLFDFTPFEYLKKYDNPQNEEQKLHNLQTKYRETFDKNILWEMLPYIRHISVRCVTKIKRGQTQEYKDEIADKVSITIIERIMKKADSKPEWVIENFKTYIYRESKHWIYKDMEDALGHSIDFTDGGIYD